MAPSLSESCSPRRLSAVLDDTPWSAETGLRLVRSLARQIQTLHEGGRLHGAITGDAVRLPEGSEPLVEAAAAARPRFGGQFNEPDVCPPALAEEDVLELPETISAADALFKRRKLPLDPRQVDLYQLGTLLCRLVTGRPVLVYMYDPWSKSAVPPEVQALLERLLWPTPGEGFTTCAELVEAISDLLAGLGADDEAVPHSETPPRGSVLRAAADDTPARGHRPSGPAGEKPSPDDGGELPFRRLGIYTIVSRIGGGGMGDVYLARDESLDRPVALKVLPADLARDKEFVDRFRAEAAAAAKVVHPNVVPIYSIDEDAGHHFFSMHFVDGESLASRLNRRKRLPPAEAVALVRQCLAGLGAAHTAGLIHRDVKPGNILIERSTGRVMLVDFGLVRRLGQSARMTATGVIMGTVDYIAPEQARGKQVDGRTDLYSLGVMFYQMLSGRLPFHADTPTAMIFQHAYESPPPLAELAPETPEPLASIVARLMAKDPADRYQDAETVLADLDRFAAGKDEPAEAILFDEAIVRPPQDARGAPTAPAPPLLSAEPSLEALPEQLRVSNAPRAWRSFRDRMATIFRRYSPQFVQELQSTTQQVDGAVAEYERRRERLARLEREARDVAAELSHAIEENRRAADLAEAKAEAAAEEEVRREALARRDACRQRVEEMAGQLSQQNSQLEEIASQLGRADATLAQLRSRRDVLKARWQAAQARGLPQGERPASSRVRRRIVVGVAVGACFLWAAVLVGFLMHSLPEKAYPPPPPPEEIISVPPPGVEPGDGDLPGVEPGDGDLLASLDPVKPAEKDLPPLRTTAGLRYDFRPGESYVYDVSIEADMPSAKETTSGTVTYQVKSVDAESGHMTLTASGNLGTVGQPKPGSHRYPYRPPGYPGPYRPFFLLSTSVSEDYGYPRTITIDRFGEVLSYDGGGNLPCVLGPIALLMIDPMPPERQANWSADGSVDLFKAEQHDPFMPPMFARPSRTRWTAQKNADYVLAGADGDAAVIRKSYRLATDQQADGKPLLEQTGKGEIRFDVKAGVPTSLEMEYSITVHEDGVTVGVTATVKSRLLSKAEAEELRKKREAELAEARARAEEAARPKPIDDAELDQVLSSIDKGDDRKVQEAVKRLAKSIPIDARRREVATALEGVLERNMRSGNREAIKALGIWGSEDNVPVLVKAVGNSSVFVRRDAIAAITNFPTPEAATAVAGRLSELSDREDAVKALQKMGQVAEDPVLPFLKSSDIFTRAAACRVLAEVGTEKSLEPLKEVLLATSNSMVTDNARKAVTAIEARQEGGS